MINMIFYILYHNSNDYMSCYYFTKYAMKSPVDKKAEAP